MNPRALAISVLARVEATQAYLNAVLDAALAERGGTDPRDNALATELCYGATRRRLTLDYALARFSDRRLDKLEDRVLAALRIGAYQLFFTRIPARAAVAETVGALKALGLDRATGFVNAILRKLSALDAPPLPPESDRLAFWSIRESHPQWLVAGWTAQFGESRALSMLEGDNRAAQLCVRINGGRISRDELLTAFREQGLDAQPTGAPTGILLVSPGKVEELFGYREGLWQVQDEAAQWVGLYADFPKLASGERLLDACAAPGGKTCHLAERHRTLAIDLHAHKLRKLSSEAERLGLTERIEARAHDATEPLPPEWGPFGGVLLDAPCSGLGTLRRHPELRYRRQPEDVQRLADLQARLLQALQAQVPRGGLLVYAVCTTEPLEGHLQVERFLAQHPDFRLDPPVLPPGAPLWNGFLRTLPGPEGMDGFFAARLRRAG